MQQNYREKLLLILPIRLPRMKKVDLKRLLEKDQSAGEILSILLPKNAKLAKALGTLGVASLANAAFQKPETAVLFYATDDTSINAEIEELIRDNGFEPVRIGGIDQSIRIEVFGDLHEFGALGKTVTLNKAKNLLHDNFNTPEYTVFSGQQLKKGMALYMGMSLKEELVGLNYFRNQSCPSCLVRCAQSPAIIPMKIFMK